MTADVQIILLLAVLGLCVAIWFVKRGRGAGSSFRVDPAELALLQRAADGDKSAARELSKRAEAESAALRRLAETDRKAALKYRDELRQKLRTLEPLTRQLAGMDVVDAKRREVEQRIAKQQTEARRELEWVDGRLRVLPK